jgi:formylglycine-generating enzyme required for sulfatase activity
MPPDELVGTTLGNYTIEAKLEERDSKTLYRAKQTNVDRQVILFVLNSQAAQDAEVVARFKADAKAKARVSNVMVSSVYEGGEANGTHFYSCEFVASPTLAQLQERGTTIDLKTALQTMKVIADVSEFFAKEKISHLDWTPNHILIKSGQPPQISNIACEVRQNPSTLAEEIAAIGKILLPSIDNSPASSSAREIATKMATSPQSFPTWKSVSDLAASKMPKSAPADAKKIQAQDLVMSKAVVETKEKNRRNIMIGSALSLTLTIGACFALYRAMTRTDVTIKDLGAMIEIPTGEFQYQDKTMTLPTFYISKYEVTIAEYANFLKFLKENPDKATSFDSPDQPKGKTHVPADWADLNELKPPMPGYYTRAKKWGKYHDAPLTLDSPVFGVDWYDAYAYAKWKGQRLPTEQEWEKAARGQSKGLYPWGDENKPEWANTGIDFTPNPEAGGEKDGGKRYTLVNFPKTDKSSFGVFGMAGNVSEWTSTIGEEPKNPVIRGGNWKTKEYHSTRRILKLSELQSDDALGFRTASDVPQ